MDMSWTPEEVRSIRETVFTRLGFSFRGQIDCRRGGSGLRLDLEGGRAVILACDKPALARGFFLLAKAVLDGQTVLHLREERRFSSCGPFIDCSRGAVMTAEACMEYIGCLASLGLNLFILYMEDTYTVPEYPYFGHLRGRYTPEELRRIDDWAFSRGVEAVPCIQTLAHLEQFLQWKESDPLRDTPSCLMIDDDKTYAFIEAEIRAVRACFRTDRIHIGMDEAHYVGLQRYYLRHGPTDRFALLRRHLDRVVGICEKYGFRPMMWSDMFFRLGSATGAYYDPDARIPPEVIRDLPEVDLVYWDYYHTDEGFFDHMLSEHEKMGRTVFAGGIWTWNGFLPNVELTRATMGPALRACAKHRVDTVIATMWGDDGNETSQFLALGLLPVFSEACWRGEEATPEETARIGERISGLPRQALRAFSCFFAGPEDDRTGKGLVYCDLLYPLLPGNPDLGEWARRFEEGKRLLRDCPSCPECLYAGALFDVVLLKARTLPAIREAYRVRDTEALKRIAEEEVPRLLSLYEILEDRHRALWERSFKRNGWEVLSLRYGAVCGRLKDVRRALLRFAAGELSSLAELDEPPLEASRRSGRQWYDDYVTPQL